MKNILKLMLVAAIVLGFGSVSYAAITGNKSIDVKANVTLVSGGLDIKVYKIDSMNTETSSDDTWDTTPKSAIDFGTLAYDTTYKIMRSRYYYAVEVAVNDNSGADWKVTHKTTPIVNSKNTNEKLDKNINVSFVNQLDKTHYRDLRKTSYEGSNNVVLSKSSFAKGWLRIYYGIANGKTDNSGVDVISATKMAGSYKGQVTITVTQ